MPQIYKATATIVIDIIAHKKNKNPDPVRDLGLVREAGLEPARPEWTLEPESSESANSTTRAYANALATALI